MNTIKQNNLILCPENWSEPACLKTPDQSSNISDLFPRERQTSHQSIPLSLLRILDFISEGFANLIRRIEIIYRSILNILSFSSNDFQATESIENLVIEPPPITLPINSHLSVAFPESISVVIPAYLDPSKFQQSIEKVAEERMKLKQTDVPESEWYNPRQQWGPLAKKHAAPIIPENIDPQHHKEWKQRLVVTLALKYRGLQYSGPKAGDPFKQGERTDIPSKAGNGQLMRGHFPGRGYGLDCSNFVSWIYNLVGIYFTSDCGELVDHPNSRESKGIGRTVDLDEKMEPGDLIFLDRRDPNNPESPPHVLIYCGTGAEVGRPGDIRNYYIDSTSSVRGGVAPRVLDGAWCAPSTPAKKNPRFVRITRPIV